MKRIFSALLAVGLALLLLTGCSNYGNTYHFETDYPTGFAVSGKTICLVAPVKDGYCFSNDSFLYHMDMDGKTSVVCSRAGCNHDKEEAGDLWKCEGYYGSIAFIQYYDGALYLVATTFTAKEKVLANDQALLIRISPDTGMREILAPVDNIGNAVYMIHRGYFYTSAVRSDNLSELKRVPISAPRSEPETVLTGEGQIIPVFLGDHVYYGRKSENGSACVVRRDLGSGKETVLTDTSDAPEDGAWLCGIYQGKLLWERRRVHIDEDTILFEKDEAFLIDPSSGETERLLDLLSFGESNIPPALYTDGQNLILLHQSEEEAAFSICTLDETLQEEKAVVLDGDFLSAFYPGDGDTAFITTDLYYSQKLYRILMDDPLKSYFVHESSQMYTAWSTEDFIGPITFD